MKKNFVRNLVMAVAVVVAVNLGGCGKQEAGVEGEGNSSNVAIENTYELTEEEKELVYRIMYAEAMSDSSLENQMVSQMILARLDAAIYYSPTPEELQWAYLVAAAQTGDEEPIIQTMGTNVAINIAKAEGISLIDVFTAPNRFSGVHNGIPTLPNGEPVTEDMLTDELKKAVDAAFLHDYTDGAIFYYYGNPRWLSNIEPKRFIREGNWVFIQEF